MSRSDNTMPVHLQEQDGKPWPRYGGSYRRIGKHTRYYERPARQRARLALRRGDEPEPTRNRHGAKYDYR